MSTQETQDLSNLSLLELFRMEVQSQSTALTEGLLVLERESQSAQNLEGLMRAAHSLKGAARIVNRPAAVRITHAMEDSFVAAQKGNLVLSRERIDGMLQGVDLLNRIAAISDEEIENGNEVSMVEVEVFVGLLASWKIEPSVMEEVSDNSKVHSSKAQSNQAPSNSVPQIPDPGTPNPDRLPPESKEPSGEYGKGSAGAARTLRVSSENLTRLLGLAGELRIVSTWPIRFSKDLLKLRRRQDRLAQSFGALRQQIAASAINELAAPTVLEIQNSIAGCQRNLAERQAELDDFDRQFTNLANRLYQGVLESRMRPFSEGIQAFPRMVRDLARELGKSVKLDILGEATTVDREILEKLEAPLNHLLRNALDHGIESPEERRTRGKLPENRIFLEARHHSGMLLVTVGDDGRGLDREAIRRRIVEKKLATAEMAERMTESELYEFLFLPGFTMKELVTEISGRGVGLDVVQTMVKAVGGRVSASSDSGNGTRFVLELPLTLSVIRALVVKIAGEAYAFPLTSIISVMTIPKEKVESLEGRQHVRVGSEHLALVPARQVLGFDGNAPVNDLLAVVVLGDKVSRYGLVVDSFHGERELVVLALDPRLGKVKDISAAAILSNRSPVLIIDVDDLLRSIDNLASGGGLASVRERTPNVNKQRRKRVLVVDDSLTVRELQRKLLSNRGYEIDVAVDGMEGWNAVREGHYDLVVTDVDMPRLDGIELVTLIKKDARFGSLPVMIVSYKDREEDRRRGLEAGADYYLTKASFHDETLLRAVADLIGGPEA